MSATLRLFAYPGLAVQQLFKASGQPSRGSHVHRPRSVRHPCATAADPKGRAVPPDSALPQKHKGELKMRARPRADRSPTHKPLRNARNEVEAERRAGGHSECLRQVPGLGRTSREERLG